MSSLQKPRTGSELLAWLDRVGAYHVLPDEPDAPELTHRLGEQIDAELRRPEHS